MEVEVVMLVEESDGEDWEEPNWAERTKWKVGKAREAFFFFL